MQKLVLIRQDTNIRRPPLIFLSFLAVTCTFHVLPASSFLSLLTTTSMLYTVGLLLAFLVSPALTRRTNLGQRGSNDTTVTYAVREPPLTTDWTYTVGTNPWPEYPRPQLERTDWLNLNGIWSYQNASSLNAVENPPFGQILQHEVLVPSCLESALSGKPHFYILKAPINGMSRHPWQLYPLFLVFNLLHHTFSLVR